MGKTIVFSDPYDITDIRKACGLTKKDLETLGFSVGAVRRKGSICDCIIGTAAFGFSENTRLTLRVGDLLQPEVVEEDDLNLDVFSPEVHNLLKKTADIRLKIQVVIFRGGKTVKYLEIVLPEKHKGIRTVISLIINDSHLVEEVVTKEFVRAHTV